MNEYSKDLLTFKSASTLTNAPKPVNPDECGYSGNACFKGSVGRECVVASRIFCPDWNNPAVFQNCTFVKRETQYRQDGITK